MRRQMLLQGSVCSGSDYRPRLVLAVDLRGPIAGLRPLRPHPARAAVLDSGRQIAEARIIGPTYCLRLGISLGERQRRE
jgi:hypothetical protein